jgi:DoxX
LKQHLFWALLFGRFVVKGAGPISLDALIGRGIAATALPLAGTVTRIFEALSRWGDPAMKLLLRCWIAALFFRSGVMRISSFDMTQMLFHARSDQLLLPPALAPRLTILIELACLVFLVLGAGTRITAIVLIGLSALVDPTNQQSIDLGYYWMVLGLIALHRPGALSVDTLVFDALRRRFPSLRGMRSVSHEGSPHVLIIGGGFGGVSAAKALRYTNCRSPWSTSATTIYFSHCYIRSRLPASPRPTSPGRYAACFGTSQMFASCSAA